MAKRSVVIGILFVLSQTLRTAASDVLTWSTGDGNWSVTGNWSPTLNAPPDTAGEAADFPDGGGTFTTTLNISPSIDFLDLANPNATLNLGGSTLTLLGPPGLTISGFVRASAGTGTIAGPISISASGQLIVDRFHVLALSGPTVANDGLMLVNHFGDFDAALLINGDLTISGSGNLLINGDNDVDRIDGAAVLTNAGDHTIHGEGAIDAAMNNQSDVAADESGKFLTLKTSNKSNTGTLRGTNGGILRVLGIQLNNAGGTIHADGGSVQFGNGATITGGTLSGSIISGVSAATLSNVTIALSAQYDVNNFTTTTLTGGSLVNDGVLRINHNSSFDASLSIDGNLTVSGGGEIFINGDNDSDRIDGLDGAVLTNASGHTIRGEGAVNVAMNNEGDVVADEAGKFLTLTTSDKSNTSTLRGTNGGILRVLGIELDNTGGTIEADGGSVQFGNSATITGGTLSGATISGVGPTTLSNVTIASGAQYDVNQSQTTTLTGSLVNNGLLRINHTGGFDASLSIDGDLTVSGDGEIFINGDNENDRIDGAAGVVLTNAAGHTIRGEGAINVEMNNQGDVVADEDGRVLFLKGVNKTNTGTLRAINGSFLRVQNITLDNNASGLFVADGGVVQFSAATLLDPVLTGPAGALYSGIGAATLSNATIQSGIQYDVNQQQTTTLTGGSLVNDGTLRINHVGNFDSILSIDGNLTVSGDGEILINGDNAGDRIDGAAGVTLMNAAGHTIRGEGAINVALDNQGDVVADESGTILLLQTADKTNTGTLRAINGSFLRVQNITLDNNASGLFVADGGVVQFSAATLLDPVLTGPAGALYSGIGAATLSNATIQSGVQYDVDRFQTTTLTGGSLVNDGTLRINHVGNFDSILSIDGNLTVSGEGEIFINGDNDSDRIDGVGGAVLTNGSDHTINGLGAINAALTNDGSVIGSKAGGALVLASTPKTNNGTFGAVSPGSLSVPQNVDGGGGWHADGGTVTLSSGVQVTTAGPIKITNNGLFQMGGAGNLTMGSDLTMDTTGRLSAQGAVTLSADVDFSMTDETKWAWSAGSTLTMTGGAGGVGCSTASWAYLEAGSDDNGIGGTGLNNFGLRNLIIGAGAAVTLSEFRDNGNRGMGGEPEALYAETLTLGSGAMLNLNGLNLYVAGVDITPGPLGGGTVVDTDVFLAGDMNCDGLVDGDDIQPFVLALLDPDGYASQYPECSTCAGDVDGDGDLDTDDAAALTTLVLTR